MTNYGPWVQGDDVDVTLSGFGHKHFHEVFTSGGQETPHDSGGDDGGIITTAVEQERRLSETIAGTYADTYDGEFYGSGAAVHVDVGPTQDSPYPFTTGLQFRETGFFVRVLGASIILESTYADSIPLPAGATGIELESLTFVPQRGDIAASMVDHGAEIASEGDPDAVPSTPIAVDYYVRPGDQPALGAVGRFLHRQYTFSTMEDNTYTLSFQVEQSDLDAALDTAIIWPQVDPRATAWGVTGQIPVPRTYYWGWERTLSVASVATTWTMRPPRHRFIYPDSSGLAPLRQFPRDDALGAGSATRIWSSSQQNSLRRRGYY